MCGFFFWKYNISKNQPNFGSCCVGNKRRCSHEALTELRKAEVSRSENRRTSVFFLQFLQFFYKHLKTAGGILFTPTFS